MGISFTCDCGRLLEATDAQVGQEMGCPACGRAFLVPSQLDLSQAQVDSTPPQRGTRRLVVWSCCAVLAGGLLGLLSLVVINKYRPAVADNPAEVDPRWTFPTPFRNTRPDVSYVSDATCAGCHFEEAKDFHTHPMGQSLAPVAAVAGFQRYDAAVRNPFEAVGAILEVELRDNRVFHKESHRDRHGKPFAEAREEVHYVIGSGVHNYSYLINRAGYLVQSPITFYSQKRIWDRSPGLENYGRNLFERAVTPDCLFCHANRVAAVPDTINRYEPPIFVDGTVIGCQRCHGPGALHVERRKQLEEGPEDAQQGADQQVDWLGYKVEGMDVTIVNPSRLPWELRDGICQQCHLEGARRILKRGREFYDYRPGLPWQMIWTVLVRSDAHEDSKFVSSVEQLYASRCYKGMQGQMGCRSCHEPHRLPEESKRITYYRDRCQSCHARRPCNLADKKRQANGDNCIACHMPRFGSSDIPHTAVTDHRIPRDPSAPPAERPEHLADGFPMRPYLPNVAGYQDQESDRARALSMIEEGRRDVEKALSIVDQVLMTWPNDLPALEAKGRGMLQVGRFEEARDVSQAILARAPRREKTLLLAALVAQALDLPDDVVDYRRRLIEVNPTSLFYRFGLATALAKRDDWAQATAECDRILRLYPPNVEARVLLVRYYLSQGDRDQARKIFDEVLALNPPNAEQLRQLFEEHLNRRP